MADEIGQHDHGELTLRCVAHRRVDTHVRGGADDQHGAHPGRVQPVLEAGADERAVTVLLDNELAGRGNEPVDELRTPGPRSTHAVGRDRPDPERSMDVIVHQLDEHHPTAAPAYQLHEGAQRFDQPRIDRHIRAERGHGAVRMTEVVLHVDHEQRRRSG